MSAWISLAAGLTGAALGIPLAVGAERLLRTARRFSWPARSAACAATALLFAIVSSGIGLSWELPAYLVLSAAAVMLGMVDLAEKRLPNAIIYPCLIVLPLLLAGAAAFGNAWPALVGAGLGAAGLFTVYFVLALISPAGIGMGDVKLSAVIGLALGYLGWSPLLVGAAAGFLIGGLVSLFAVLTGRATLKTSIPFGPAMLAGMFFALAMY